MRFATWTSMSSESVWTRKGMKLGASIPAASSKHEGRRTRTHVGHSLTCWTEGSLGDPGSQNGADGAPRVCQPWPELPSEIFNNLTRNLCGNGYSLPCTAVVSCSSCGKIRGQKFLETYVPVYGETLNWNGICVSIAIFVFTQNEKTEYEHPFLFSNSNWRFT